MEYYPNTVNYATFLVNSIGLEISSITTLVSLGLKILTLSQSLRKSKKIEPDGPKVGFFAVECLYEYTNLCKLEEVHSVFAVFVRGIFRIQSNIYKGAFCKKG